VPTIPSRRGAKNSEFVYFVRAQLSGLIKIGIARNMPQRLRALQTGNADRLTVMGIIRDKDPVYLERIIHGEYRRQREFGEWFRESPDLLDFIRQHARTLAEDEQDRRAAMMADLIARGVVDPTRRPKARPMGRKAALAHYKAVRGIT